MNTRFKLFLINYLNQRRVSRDSGFALPMAIMVGACIIVVGLAVVIQAQGNKSNVTSQVTSSKAMAIAESGATQVTNFLNNNRGLIPYSACVTQNTDGSCGDTNTVKSWYGAGLTTSGSSTSIPNIAPSPATASPSPSASPSCSTSGSSTSLPSNYQQVSTSTIASWANSTATGSSSGWKDSADGLGQYRLVSYRTYKDASASSAMNPDTDAPTSAVTAKLIVEGRVNQSGSGASATDGSNGGKARVEITIPVTATTGSGAAPSASSANFPGLWAKSFNFGNNNSANAQVWDSSNCGTGNTAMSDARILDYTSQNINVLPSNPLTLASGVTDTAKANNGNKKLYDGTVYRTSNSVDNPLPKVMKSQDFPSLPNGGRYPSSSTPALVYGPNTTTTGTVTENSLDCSSLSSVTFPRAAGQGGATVADKSSANVAYSSNSNDSGTYVYRCTGGMSIGGSDVTLGRTGKETLVFYVNGTFNASANGGVFPVQGTGTWSRGVFYVKNDAQVKANGNVGRLLAPFALQFYVYNSGNMNPGFDMGGNGSLYAFVFAPTSIGLSKGTEDLGGALWIKSYEVDGNNKVWQAIFDDTQLMVDLPDSTPYTTYNLGGSPTAWKRVSTN